MSRQGTISSYGLGDPLPLLFFSSHLQTIGSQALELPSTASHQASSPRSASRTFFTHAVCLSRHDVVPPCLGALSQSSLAESRLYREYYHEPRRLPGSRAPYTPTSHGPPETGRKVPLSTSRKLALHIARPTQHFRAPYSTMSARLGSNPSRLRAEWRPDSVAPSFLQPPRFYPTRPGHSPVTSGGGTSTPAAGCKHRG